MVEYQRPTRPLPALGKAIEARRKCFDCSTTRGRRESSFHSWTWRQVGGNNFVTKCGVGDWSRRGRLCRRSRRYSARPERLRRGRAEGEGTHKLGYSSHQNKERIRRSDHELDG